MNLLDLLAGNTQPGGLAGQVLGQQTPTGLGALLQSAQSPGAMALSGQQAPPRQPWDEQQRQMPGGMPTAHHGLFGGGTRGTIAGIAGIIGDALSAGAGRQPTFAPMLAERSKQDFEQQQQMDRETLRAKLKAQFPDPSTAARMAAEIGLKPGTPQYMQFIRRYAFTPRIVGVPNAQGGVDQTMIDTGDDGGAPTTQTIGDQTYYNVNGQWYDNPEGQ